MQQLFVTMASLMGTRSAQTSGDKKKQFLVAITFMASAIVAAPIDDNGAALANTTTIGSARAPIFREADHEQLRGHNGTSNASAQSEAKQDRVSTFSIKTRLMKELREVHKCESHKMGVIEVELENDNIQEWNVKLFVSEDPLHGDLMKLKEMGRKDHIMLHISYGQNYPAEPPFVRVVYPVLRGPSFFGGGALCMDVLTKHGRKSSYSCETLILSILTTLIEAKVRVELKKGFDEVTCRYSDHTARVQFEKVK